ncbi:hypothetical protein AGMMS49545_16820 [Betaproteobacteria bacterium]|nr:hypothetical protein AGMMS49545_16820 [Betaproteobacteria bacterium]GHU46729.1 hypothetical protein AGMMS50289_20770 [Betaproteobacteria bacterium]
MVLKLGWSNTYKATVYNFEKEKSYPERFPMNEDSVGIEIVGMSTSKYTYEAPSAIQNESLTWLVSELYEILSIGKEDVYRHPNIAYKNSGEAKDAKWE